MTTPASKLLGSVVVDREGQRVGRVSDLLVDVPGSANICYALVQVEQGPENRQRTVAVPWSLLDREAPARLVLGVSRHSLERLKNLGEE